MEIRNETYWYGLWAAAEVAAIVMIVLAIMWWRGSLEGNVANEPVPAPSAAAISPAPAATPAPTGQQ